MADQSHAPAVRETKRSPPHHHKETHGTSDDIDESTPVTSVKGPNVFERVKEEVEAVAEAVHPKKGKDKDEKDKGIEPTKTSPHHRHHKETHGRSDDIDETTPVEDIKGPSLFQRMKEEVEAIVAAILPKKKDSNDPK